MESSGEISDFVDELEFVPKDTKALIANLLVELGHDWMTELLNTEDRKGDGTSPGIVFEVALDIEESNTEPSLEKENLQPGTGLLFFLDDVDSIYEDFLEDDDNLDLDRYDWDPFRDVLSLWVTERIDYLRSVRGLNTVEARIQSYEELQTLDLGGEQLYCLTCGVLFWDNLERLSGPEKHFCSIQCQEKVEKDCITCGAHFVVGRANRGWRNIDRLSGFCSSDCAVEEHEKRSLDKRYISGVKRRLENFGFDAQIDESVTRRAIFDRDGGKCYMCGADTHFVRQGDWDPLLANLEHRRPVSKGGSHTWENVALSCQLCNIRKGSQDHNSS